MKVWAQDPATPHRSEKLKCSNEGQLGSRLGEGNLKNGATHAVKHIHVSNYI